MSTLMWEVVAAPGRLDELLEHLQATLTADALLFRSADEQGRVVVIDPSGHPVPVVPSELTARPAHSWPFEAVPRRPLA